MFILVLGVSLGGCAPARDADPRVARIRERLRLTPPYEIVKYGYYLNGGSSSYEIRGANRRRLTVYWDGAMRGVGDFDEYRRAFDSLGYFPPDTIPRLLYLGGDSERGDLLPRDLRREGRPIPVGSPQESTLIDLLTLAAEQHIGKEWVARVDSIHDAGRIEGLTLLQSWDDEQRRYAAAAGLAWSLEEQRIRGFWLPANDPSRPWLDSARVSRNLPTAH
jgi:hypothetical protein